MSKEEVLQLIEKDLKFSGSMYIAFGIFLLLPGILILLVILDTMIEVPAGDILGLFQLQAYFLIFTIPGVLLIRFGIRKRKGRNNKIYAAYAKTPDQIAWVYDRFTNFNGRNLFYVVMCDDSGKRHEIQSNIGEYRNLYQSIKVHCPNAVFGFKEEWSAIYRRNPKDFKVNVMQFEISIGSKFAK